MHDDAIDVCAGRRDLVFVKSKSGSAGPGLSVTNLSLPHPPRRARSAWTPGPICNKPPHPPPRAQSAWTPGPVKDRCSEFIYRIGNVKITSSIEFQSKSSLKLSKKNCIWQEPSQRRQLHENLCKISHIPAPQSFVTGITFRISQGGRIWLRCNLNCKDRGKDHHGGCQKIEKKKEESRLRASSRQELHVKSAVGFMWDNWHVRIWNKIRQNRIGSRDPANRVSGSMASDDTKIWCGSIVALL